MSRVSFAQRNGPGIALTIPDPATTWMRGSDMAQDTCSTSDCGNKPGRGYRGMCRKHYDVWREEARQNGQLREPGLPLVERLARRFMIDEDGCWIWTGQRKPSGYGIFGHQHVTRHAHRWTWIEVVGPLTDDEHLDHLCKNRACINPDHMEVVTIQENIKRRAPGRNHQREKTHCPQGHPYDALNTGRAGANARYCRTCNRNASRRRRGKPPLSYADLLG